MKKVSLKSLTALSFVLTMVYTGTVSAHSQSGVLGSAAGSTDLYVVSCSTDAGGVSNNLAMQVKTGTASSWIKVGVRTQKDKKATNSTDLINGDSVPSPMSYNYGGDGVYYVTVSKTLYSSVNVPYTLDFHCQSSTGNHTGTDWFQAQNQ